MPHLQIHSMASAGNERFSFESTDTNILADHDPRVDSTRVLVRGVGADPGRTPLILLSPSLWSGSGRSFRYDDPSGANGGLTSAVLR